MNGYDDGLADPRIDRADAAGRSLVNCDQLCAAYLDPRPDDPAELAAAAEHWRRHGLLGGCAHAR